MAEHLPPAHYAVSASGQGPELHPLHVPHLVRWQTELGTLPPITPDARLATGVAEVGVIEADPTAAGKPVAKLLSEAVEAFLASWRDLAPGTVRNHRWLLRCLETYAAERGIKALPELEIEHIDQFRDHR